CRVNLPDRCYHLISRVAHRSGLHGSDFSFGFSTKYHDREVGLIAYQLRSYSPRLGRWLNFISMTNI
ncbi:MAG: hypothetical protein IK084_05600, partial [Bacteroidaceae bacterium]|nr:hypothetical protein [Bacteroidaceae bacterium]